MVGQRRISSRVWSSTRGRKASRKASDSLGVLYIFQLPAMMGLRMTRLSMGSLWSQEITGNHALMASPLWALFVGLTFVGAALVVGIIFILELPGSVSGGKLSSGWSKSQMSLNLVFAASTRSMTCRIFETQIRGRKPTDWPCAF